MFFSWLSRFFQIKTVSIVVPAQLQHCDIIFFSSKMIIASTHVFPYLEILRTIFFVL